MTAGGFPNAGSHPFYISAYTLGQRDLGQIFGSAGPASALGCPGRWRPGGRAGALAAGLARWAGQARLGARAPRCAGAGRYGLGVEFAG